MAATSRGAWCGLASHQGAGTDCQKDNESVLTVTWGKRATVWPRCHHSCYSPAVSVSPLCLLLPPVPGYPLPVLAGNGTAGSDAAGAPLDVPC